MVRLRRVYSDVVAKPGLYLGAGLAAAMLVVVVLALYGARATDRKAARRETANLALSLSRDIGQALSIVDLSLLATLQGLRLPDIQTVGGAARQSMLFDGATDSEGFSGAFVTDADGNVVDETKNAAVQPHNVSDQPYFKAAQALSEPMPIFVRPVAGPHDDGAFVGLARRITRADGSFDGVVVGGINLTYVQTLFAPIDLGSRGSIALLTSDGMLLARRPPDGAQIGQNIATAELFRRPADAPLTTYTSISVVDGVERIYSFSRLRRFPLVIALGLATSDVDTAWKHRTLLIGGALVTLFAVAAGLIGALLRQIDQRTAAQLAARAAAQEHASARARLDVLFQNTSDSMFIACTEDGETFAFETVNPIWEKLTGISAAEATGKNPLNYMPANRAAIVLAGWLHCVRERTPTHYSYSLDTADGERHWEVAVAPVLADGAPVHRLIGVGRDVTERQKVEARLRQMERMEAVAQLTTGIAHDFNNMLQAILGALEVLQDQTGLDEEGRMSARFAEIAARRGATLTHRLLAFSRKQSLTPILVTVADIVRNVSAQMTDLPGPTIKTVVDIGADVWPVRVDQAQLSDCLFNLATNARDSLTTGGVVTFRAENYSPKVANGLRAGDYVRLSVGDNGSGMSAETAARAFEPFFTTKLIGQGAGLGLSMVEGFARQSGGDVQIQSALGEGTTVSIWLPRGSAALTHTAQTGHAGGRQTSGSSRRILLVDDEQSVRQTLSLMLKRAGFSATAVHSGEAALDLLNTGEVYDLLVTDQSMPGITGCELIEETTRYWPSLPAMLITGYDKVNGLDQLDGRIPVLHKPFGRADFIQQVNILVGAHGQASPSG